MQRLTRRHRAWLALGATLALVVTGCTHEDGTGSRRPFVGETVTIFGPQIEDEQEGFKRAFATLEEETGLTIQLVGHRDFEERIDSLVAGGNPPDIAMFPQPGKVRDFAEEIVPLPDDPDDPDDVGSLVQENFAPDWTDPVTVDTQLLAVPTEANFKSLVWYSPRVFRQFGYVVPTTFDGFLQLAEQMARNGHRPFCLGLQSEFATGWPLTDWIEELLLRIEGPEVYDDWYRHDIPFDDPRVVAAAERAYDLLAGPDVVYGSLETSAARSWTEAGWPVLEGDCLMYRMANYYRAYWPEDVDFGPQGDIDAFYLPDTQEGRGIALSGGIYAAAFSDDPAVMRTIRYLASETFADLRASHTTDGFLSPHEAIPPDQYQNPLDRQAGRMLREAQTVRFDASDLMPGRVGAGTFWHASVDISTGEKTVAEAFAEIEANWPPECPEPGSVC
jgi:alpha-glucoside transport system substrate-binding protein